MKKLDPTQQARQRGITEGLTLAVEVLANVTFALALWVLVRPTHPLPGEDDSPELATAPGPRMCRTYGCIDNAGHEGPHYYGDGIGDEPNDGTHPVRQAEPEDEPFVPMQRGGSDDL